jgi:hypothetical protein
MIRLDHPGDNIKRRRCWHRKIDGGLPTLPDPRAVADLVMRRTHRPWPSGAADCDRYFVELGLVDAGPADAPSNDPDTQWRLTPPLSGVVEQASASSAVSCSAFT